jgi:hypothetical protein
MKMKIITVGVFFILVLIPICTAFTTPEIKFRDINIQKNSNISLTKFDEPPDWATNSFIGYSGITDINGKPQEPSRVIMGYSQDDFKEKFFGITVNLSNEEADSYFGGYIAGPFLFGIIGDINSDWKTPIVGLGGRNETHFYFRAMAILGPTFYIIGKYTPL